MYHRKSKGIEDTRAAFSTGISLGSKGTAFSGAPWTKSNSLKPSFDTKVYGCFVSLKPCQRQNKQTNKTYYTPGYANNKIESSLV